MNKPRNRSSVYIDILDPEEVTVTFTEDRKKVHFMTSQFSIFTTLETMTSLLNRAAEVKSNG